MSILHLMYLLIWIVYLKKNSFRWRCSLVPYRSYAGVWGKVLTFCQKIHMTPPLPKKKMVSKIQIVCWKPPSQLKDLECSSDGARVSRYGKSLAPELVNHDSQYFVALVSSSLCFHLFHFLQSTDELSLCFYL